MQKVIINELKAPKELAFETVERKGIGHPDTLCDAIAEQASRDYSKYFFEAYGRIAHHWFDKVMLFGGEAHIDFGKGELTYPYTVIFAGKAVLQVGSNKIPLENILHDAAAKVLSKTLKDFVPQKHLKTEIRVSDCQGPGQGSQRYRPQSGEELMELDTQNRVSNDCNICVGYAPLTSLEHIVLSLEQELSKGDFKNSFPDTGYDIKIVGTRCQDDIILQVNLPFIASLISNYTSYKKRVAESEFYILNYVKNQFAITPSIEVNPEKLSGRAYLTVTGSVADTGDIGVVGRGNRINGLITPFRPMSIEASCGKNPLDHTGKLYNILAMRLSEDIYQLTSLSNVITVSTTKGKAINKPNFVAVSVKDWDKKRDNYQKEIKQRVTFHLDKIFELSREIIFNGITQW